MATDPPPMPLATELDRVGRAAGLDRVGFTSAEPFDRARVALDERRAAGFAGTMQFTYRNPARATDPRRTLPTARSIVVGALAYPTGGETGWAGHGRVGWYATDDHYGRLRDALGAIADRL